MANTTPMMDQYLRIKKRHGDAILFFRLGDFYEMFQQDAKEASRLLGLTLTKRNGVPMCGIPYHASSGYIARLLKSGKKIAVCEQIRLPKGGKGIADREVVEIITPGTVVDEDFLDRSSNNYLVSVSKIRGGMALAAVDISTGTFFVTQLCGDMLLSCLRKELIRLSPREILIQESLLSEDENLGRYFGELKGLVVNSLPDWSYDRKASYERMKRVLGTANLKGFGLDEDAPEIAAAGVLLEYLEENAKNLLVHIKSVRRYQEKDYLGFDESTLKNLELTRNTQDGGETYTLFEVLNHTKTAMGSRELKQWLLQPLIDEVKIERRQKIVTALYHDQEKLEKLRSSLHRIYDLERLSARLALEKAHGKDLLSIRDTLREAENVHEILSRTGGAEMPSFPKESRTELAKIGTLLADAIMESPSILITDGNLIREGFNKELDELRSLKANRKQVLDSYLEDEKNASGISNLRIKFNKIIGYYIEVSKAQVPSVPKHFIRRQSLVTGERFTTERLIELETSLNTASEKIIALEKDLFLEVRRTAKEKIGELLDLSRFLSEIDVLQSLAQAATVQGFSMPKVLKSTVLRIVDGRHPVVERHMPDGDFVPNSLTLDGEQLSFALITGPNMAGKSTYLRQTALIVVMAQIGSFVPAREAEIGIIDRIFCRVGAQDNLARGESTFLVEMNETANILRNATSDSLVIMDEVGRGTSTNDGLAIAWAVTEHILNVLAVKTLFATHFHELTALEHPRLFNLSMDIREERGKLIFLKRVKEGPSNNSYGIHVAKLAGLPEEVLDRADEILEHLADSGKKQSEAVLREPLNKGGISRQPSLFSNAELLKQEILSFPLDERTPLEAMNFLARWQTIFLDGKD